MINQIIKFMKKISLIILIVSLSSCSPPNPPSSKAIAAGLLTHARYHNEQRSAGKTFTNSEEFVAKSTGDHTTKIWDTYQKDNTAFNMTVQDAQNFLDKSHAKINESFPAGKKPFVQTSKK